MQAFCFGWPGWMCWIGIPSFSAQISSLPLMYSGPLSTLVVPGLPRQSMILS
jgi:hypothetical protein